MTRAGHVAAWIEASSGYDGCDDELQLVYEPVLEPISTSVIEA